MAEEIQTITSKTLVPLSLVVGLLGGGGWFTKQYLISEANAKSIIEINKKLENKVLIENERWESIQSKLNEINGRLSNIEGRLQK